MNNETVKINAYKSTFTLGNTEFSVFCDHSFLNNQIKRINEDDPTLHNHFFNEILLIDLGDGFLEIGDEQVPFNSETLIYLPKHVLHVLKAKEYKYFSIGFTFRKTADKNKLFSSFDKFSEVFTKPYVSNIDKTCLPIAKRIAKHLLSPTEFSYFTIQTLIQELILGLADLMDKNSSAKNQPTLIADFDFAINQKINNLKDNSKLKDIAEEFFISERQLSRIIKKQYGVSFTERKNQLRIESAKQLLKNGDLSINKIAEKVCFCDTRTFIKQFTKSVGFSPIEYRKKHKI